MGDNNKEQRAEGGRYSSGCEVNRFSNGGTQGRGYDPNGNDSSKTQYPDIKGYLTKGSPDFNEANISGSVLYTISPIPRV